MTALPTLLWLAIAGCSVSWLIGALLRQLAAFFPLIDVPNPRSSHVTPMPRGGGLGIVAGTVGGLLLLRPLGLEMAPVSLWALVGGGTVVAAVSFVDDLRHVPAGVRLGVHLAAAMFAAVLVGSMSAVDPARLGVEHLGWIALPVTVLWIAGMTNAYNFMDGIDGLAGTQAVTAAASWAVIGWWLGHGELAAVGVLITATTLGFLAHNWSPARLFMSDVGSAFLGYALAVTTVIASQEHAVLAVAGGVLLWPFIFDPVYTMIRRAKRRENLLTAHRSHLYQRLVAAGWGHRAVCGLYLILAGLAAVTGLALVANVPWAPVVTAAYLAGSVVAVGGLVYRAETSYRPRAAVTGSGSHQMARD